MVRTLSHRLCCRVGRLLSKPHVKAICAKSLEYAQQSIEIRGGEICLYAR
jgi:hypothetical protein